MGQTKQNCSWIPTQNIKFRLRNSHPDWEMHPDWTAALKHLDAYNLWICEVVFPIAFQWVEEHKNEVYKNIPDHLKDDVGTVVERAFQIVQALRSEASANEEQKFHRSIDNNTFDPNSTNPTWQVIAKELATEADKVKEKFRSQLPGTTRKSFD